MLSRLLLLVCTAAHFALPSHAQVTLPSQTQAVLPAMRYQYTSFATSAPEEAAAFCSKYFDAVPLTPDQFETHKNVPAVARVNGVRFNYHKEGKALYHDVYFISDPSKVSGSMSVETYEDYLHRIHRFDVQETWDWFQDWHLCLTAPGGDVDGVASRLLRDGIPFVTRSHYSLYVEIPFGITFQVRRPLALFVEIRQARPSDKLC
jgi:hypothetical protein